MSKPMLPRGLAVALLLLGGWGCKDSFHVGANNPDGALGDGSQGSGGSGGNLGTGGVSNTASATGGSSASGGAGGTSASPDAALADTFRAPSDAPEPKLDTADGPRLSMDVPGNSICLLPKEVGNCDGVCRAYWYNQATGHCEVFSWGCCGGNANNFETIEACMMACESGTVTDAAVTDGRANSDGSGALSVDGLGEAGGATGSDLMGVSCRTDLDCPADSRCCNGSDPSCDGTRLPQGDRMNPGQFVPSSDGLTVTDTITGLMWQRDGSGPRAGCSGEGNLRCTWNEAQAYCASLTLGNFDDWRLPGWNELINITDLTNDGSTPPLDQSAFPGTPMEGFLTSSLRSTASCTGEMYLNFSNVTLGTCAAQPLRVRCVRGSRCYPKTRFVVLDDEKDVDGAQIRDALTGLVWQQLVRTPAPECASWRDAQVYCSSLGQGFRLPTFKELLSLIGPEMRVDWTIFSPTRCDYTWTSTPYGGSDATLTGYARCPRESSLDPSQNWMDIRPRYGVRCVR